MKTQQNARNTILVVDDNRVGVETIAPILKPEGYEVHHTSGGRKCVESAIRIRPDLILMDAGDTQAECLETCRQLKDDALLKAIPVVFMVSNSHCWDLEDVYKSGASDFIRKPLDRIELLWRIDLLLTLRQAMEKMKEIETLNQILDATGGVCHSLNQPLQFVLGAIQILLMDTPAEDKNYKSLDKIREKVEQMGDITRKLAALTRSRSHTR